MRCLGAPAVQGGTAADADADADAGTGVSTSGFDEGWLVTTEAAGSEGSEAGVAGRVADAASTAGNTTAVAGGESGACFEQATSEMNEAVDNARIQLAFIDLLHALAAFDRECIETIDGTGARA